jgi:type II pantothenate kinase
MFVDNAGADIVLGMLPFAREFLRLGCEVVLAANSQPAINDVTSEELRLLLVVACGKCGLLRAARDAALREVEAQGGVVPPVAGLPRRASYNSLADAAAGWAAPVQRWLGAGAGDAWQRWSCCSAEGAAA